ncbi:juvenile hormone epoxide hydrolase 1-like [Phlebotomus papatasi]|uniref:juvenile hormone epoxide hydrolase 1-like n=1 Tax=Phlebotomus papatasi TaxID=29031 RepID=UPI002484543E|nr:juvenile hormone epoxide hydrolase 1-like [Phlebotomus papatasi]XP_055698149.1 juvenile hormone epoxide hydrolase 1-like [Phlebotomus papatasi]XP_055698150.1 juvenile hormone epoxide hydrolase 1-like [Phlebotomus papatasi]
MSLLKNFILIFIGMCGFLGVRIYRQTFGPLPKPNVDVAAYWGPGDRASYKEDTAVHPFKISYSAEVISKLKTRLENVPEYHPPLEGVNFEYGFNSNHLKQVIKYWRDGYLSKWELRQTYLNKYPHFKTQIQGLDMHFIHVKPAKASGRPVLPILLLHGWPGSVVEFYSLIEKLKGNEEYDFEIVAPSLPGYGWSQASAKKDLGYVEIAVIMRNLMTRLGYQKFYIQGGDWGSIIGSSLATLFPENVIGYHSNMCGAMAPSYAIKMTIASFYPSYFIPKEFVHFFYPFWSKFSFILEESGYMHIQCTKPDTIGTALTDNPIGLAAYILEKFSTWTNRDYRNLPDGGLSKRFTMDSLLDNIMVYYLTNSITTSQRLYSEAFTFRQLAMNMDRVPTSVPTGCARFQYDLSHSIDWTLKDKFLNLVHSTYYEQGGHFAAMEVPDVMYKDLMDFIGKVQNRGKATKSEL